MRTPDAVRLLAALAHEARLGIFRLLVGRPGLTAGELATALDMPPSSLSFHLKDLRLAGLIECRRAGRVLLYTANAGAAQALAGYLTEGCCFGHSEIRLTGGDAMDSEAKVYNVLFLCTGNSARSIMAEAMLNREGAGRFRAFSAGSHPRGAIDPITREMLARGNYAVDGLRSKSWDEFMLDGAPVLDFVFTVCDSAAAEVCPVWPGQPLTAHWGVPDPVAFEGTAKERHLAFADVYRMLYNRIGIFTSLPIRALDRLTLQRRLDEIGAQGVHDGAV